MQRERPVGGTCRRHHPAFEPGKALPLAALGLQIGFQRSQRNGWRPRVAVGAQRQIEPEHKTVLRGLPHQGKHSPHPFAKKLLVGDAAPARVRSCRLTVLIVDVNQINVAGDVEFAGTELAHAHDAQLAALAIRIERRTVHGF